MNGKWVYDLYNDEIWENEVCDTREEAIVEGMKAAKEEGLRGFYVGLTKSPELTIDAGLIVEYMQESLWEQVGESAERWSPKREDINKLQVMLDEVFEKWQKESGNEITCYQITETEYIDIKGDCDEGN